jgi:hypothetical protein
VLTLDSLLIQTGELADLGAYVARWSSLAGELRRAYPGPDWKDSVAELCTVYHKHGKKPFTHTKPYGTSTNQIPVVTDFLQDFMERNGQWPYIKHQKWYTSGDYVIAVDINYYPDRSAHKGTPVFHKDTGGNNIFVNLIFDNQDTIEATEWIADLNEPSLQRAEWQKKLLPADHLKELAAARKSLTPTYKDMEVSGGVTEGRYVYLSWVDDLIWHATPSTTRRVQLDEPVAVSMYDALGRRILEPVQNDDKRFHFQHTVRNVPSYIGALAVLGSIAECESTALHQWLKTEKKGGPQDLTDTTGPEAWRKLYAGATGKDTYVADVRKRAAEKIWRVTATSAEAIAKDTTIAGSESIQETPVGLAGRPRANSNPSAEFTRVNTLNANTPRTFIRTWVRVLPATSDELTTNKVVF